MPTYEESDAKSPRNAAKVWALLICAARQRNTYTYTDVSQVLWGHPNAALAVGQALEPVFWHCDAHGLPPLTILVVNADSGLPGAGFLDHVAVEQIPGLQEDVFGFNWFGIDIPQITDLEPHVGRKNSQYDSTSSSVTH